MNLFEERAHEINHRILTIKDRIEYVRTMRTTYSPIPTLALLIHEAEEDAKKFGCYPLFAASFTMLRSRMEELTHAN